MNWCFHEVVRGVQEYEGKEWRLLCHDVHAFTAGQAATGRSLAAGSRAPWARRGSSMRAACVLAAALEGTRTPGRVWAWRPPAGCQQGFYAGWSNYPLLPCPGTSSKSWKSTGGFYLSGSDPTCRTRMQPGICDLRVRLDICYTIHRMLLWSCGKTVARGVAHCSSMQKLKNFCVCVCVCIKFLLLVLKKLFALSMQPKTCDCGLS